MPCWQVNKAEVNLSGMNRELLEAALKALGYYFNTEWYSKNRGYDFSADCVNANSKHDRCSVVIEGGKVSFITSTASRISMQDGVNSLKRAYSEQVIASTAKRFGWNLKKQGDRQFVASRRG